MLATPTSDTSRDEAVQLYVLLLSKSNILFCRVLLIMEEDYFEQEYEDELDAFRQIEMEEEASNTAASKRSLFGESTPKTAGNAFNDSFPMAFDASPTTPEKLPKAKRQKTNSTSSPKIAGNELGRGESYDSRTPVKPREFKPASVTGNRGSSVSVRPPTQKFSGEKKHRVYSRIPPGGEYIPVTATDGVKSGYMNVETLASDDLLGREAHVTAVAGQTNSSGNLLNADISSLKQQIDEKKRRKAVNDLDQLKELSEEYDEYSEEPREKERHRLWVDVYSPKLYIDLMSDESVNRVLLRWMKMWDYLVFKKHKPSRKVKKSYDSKGVQGAGGKGLNKQTYQEFMKKKYEDLGLEDDFDSLFRPVQKVVLLCGRPGLGKTTLAHVVASHAGYNVVEMNASDERTAQAFKDKIEDSLTMQPLLGGKESRPNCLLIDEIDGAPAAAINVLLSKITDPPSAGEAKKQRKSQTMVLQRPIICICNDLYAPALRPLRQHALVLNFPTQCPSKLATRLLEICQQEALFTDMSTLMALCKKAACDIRSCLNTLQFVRRRKSELSMRSLAGLAIGSKDEQRSLFSFWQQVFQNSLSSRSSSIPSIYTEEPMGPVDVVDNTISGRMERIYREAQACGEFNRMVQGLHENFINMKYKDSNMQSIRSGMEWLCFTDQLNQKVISQQAFILSGYLPYLAVVFHLHFSQTSVPKITYPKAQFEASSRQGHMSSLLASLSQNVCPHVHQFISPLVLTLDVLPLLVDVILQPNMRPVNIQLYSTSEKAMLREMVSSMIDYNLTYAQHKNTDGVYAYLLEPPVDDIIRFPDTKQSRKALSYTAKQLIANEVQQEKQRRLDIKSSKLNEKDAASAPSTPTVSTASKRAGEQELQATGATPKRAKTTVTDMITPNHKQKLLPKNITPSQKLHICDD
ncbi:CHTF18 [Bugula neritina]|uniref:CHTF18 n=1 Tax=Bugula neritina TaxID=10212 RepID=A0A7J7JVV8_BUGNE|nr:CHTF18 [Bugula neritina]